MRRGHIALSRRHWLKAAGAAALTSAHTRRAGAGGRRRPNVIVVLADDLGYGDLGSYGGRMIATPALDALAADGARLTDFYASANICTSSRAGLMTGRYPIRTGLAHGVIMPSDDRGLPPAELTLAEALKPDYATAVIGKWHLGHVEPYWPPTRQGFDLFFGLPYSHDMKPLALYESAPGVELTREDVDYGRLTQRFFERGLRFVEQHRDRPFFLLLALTAPHLPLDPHPDHAGRSRAADYGDVVEEVDANIAVLRRRLAELGLREQTLLIVTSDNGPWFEGSVGPLRDRKGGAGWDGGYRVPFLACQPGRIPAGLISHEIAMNIDLLPTLVAWTGMPMPDVTLDGRDITALLTRPGAPSPHDELILFNNEHVAGLRTSRWKLVTRSYYRSLEIPFEKYGAPLLFDVRADPAETYNLASRYPEVVVSLQQRLEAARQTLGAPAP